MLVVMAGKRRRRGQREWAGGRNWEEEDKVRGEREAWKERKEEGTGTALSIPAGPKQTGAAHTRVPFFAFVCFLRMVALHAVPGIGPIPPSPDIYFCFSAVIIDACS